MPIELGSLEADHDVPGDESAYMKTRVGWAVLTLGVALLGGPALADVYTWVDKEGTVHFQDDPPATGRRVKKLESLPVEPSPAEPALAPDEGGRKRAQPPQQSGLERPQAKPKPAPTVELFTTSWCPWCKKAREYFKSRGIKFTAYDIEKDPGALERKVGIDGDKHVPTAIIGGKVVKGYSPSEYQAALEQP